jgi:hypothetical protein
MSRQTSLLPTILGAWIILIRSQFFNLKLKIGTIKLSGSVLLIIERKHNLLNVR